MSAEPRRCTLGCQSGASFANLKAHVASVHLPPGYLHLPPRQAAMSLHCLRAGLECQDYIDLVTWVNSMGGLPGATTDEEDRLFIRGMAEYLQELPPSAWSFNPILSSALLFHWEVVLLMLEYAPGSTRDAFAQWRPMAALKAGRAPSVTVPSEPRVNYPFPSPRSFTPSHTVTSANSRYEDATTRAFINPQYEDVMAPFRHQPERRVPPFPNVSTPSLPYPYLAEPFRFGSSQPAQRTPAKMRLGSLPRSELSSSSRARSRSPIRRRGSVRSATSEQPRRSECSIPAVDTHFHLDRLRREVGTRDGKSGTLAAILQRGDREAAERQPLRFCVANFCDEREQEQLLGAYKQNRLSWVELQDDPRLRLSFGLHPRLCRRDKKAGWLDSRIDLLKQLLQCPGVVALGEIGLDYAGCPVQEHDKQARAVECILRSLAPLLHGRPVVLHLRDADPARRDPDPPSKAHEDMLNLLLRLVRQSVLQDDQSFQLHCFQGSQSIVQRWLAAFPQTHFSVGGRVEGFFAYQVQGLCAIPSHRLLLETDAPHMRSKTIRHRSFSIPNDVHLVAEEVARLRGQPLHELLEACNSNACQFFGLH